MTLFKQEKTGRGVQKGGPKKKPFFQFWEIFGNKFWKLIQVNLIFVLFCIPVVTFGPALAAMTQVMRKFTIGEPIFVFHEFKTAFKKNFKQSFFIGIFDIVFVLLIVFNLNFYINAFEDGSGLGNKLMLAFSLGICFIFYMMHFYIYPQIVALNLKMGQILRNSFILTIAGLKRSLAAFFSTAAILLVFVLFIPYSVVVLPILPAAWISFIATFCAYPVIQKHIIDPYYEARGEKNPEYARYDTEDVALFVDKGGSEEPAEVSSNRTVQRTKTDNVKVKGKVIR